MPPDALSAITLYRQPEPQPPSLLRRAGKVLGWIALVLVIVACGLAGGIYLWFHKSVAAINASPIERHNIGPRLNVLPPSGAAIALVLGYDHRAGQGNASSRSDSMMLLRADPGTHTVSMLSLPRDMAVPINPSPIIPTVCAMTPSCACLHEL